MKGWFGLVGLPTLVVTLDLRVGHTMDVLSPFISVLCHSEWLPQRGPVHVLMLSIQAVRGLPRLRAPGIVPCINSLVSSWCDHSVLASLLWRKLAYCGHNVKLGLHKSELELHVLCRAARQDKAWTVVRNWLQLDVCRKRELINSLATGLSTW